MEIIITFYLAFVALILGVQIMAYLTHRVRRPKH